MGACFAHLGVGAGAAAGEGGPAWRAEEAERAEEEDPKDRVEEEEEEVGQAADGADGGARGAAAGRAGWLGFGRRARACWIRKFFVPGFKFVSVSDAVFFTSDLCFSLVSISGLRA